MSLDSLNAGRRSKSCSIALRNAMPEARSVLLDGACSNDPELRREVEALLSCEASAGDYVQAAVRVELDTVGFPLVG